MSFIVPAPLTEFDLTMQDGAIIKVRRHGKADAPARLFLSHGNGFAIDGYLPFWAPLCARFDVVVFDMRNHGRNPLGDPPNHTYAAMARDIEDIFAGVTARLGAKASVGGFHSMAGRAAMKHAVEIGWRWDALVLFDPPNIAPEGHESYAAMCDFEARLADWARARRHRYFDPGELAEEYAASRAHRTWVPGAHAAMARAVLRLDDATGDWVLAFPGALEAETYTANIPMNLWPMAGDFGGPVKLIGADYKVDRPMITAIANKTLADEGGYAYETVPGTGHMLQLQRPYACIRAMLSFLEERGIAY